MSEPKKIRRLEDIPSIFAMKVQPVDWIVHELIARKTITELFGVGGAGKTAMTEKMAVAVALGATFFGRACKRTPVLYLDYENPDFEVKRRLELLAGGPVDGLHVWGMWNEERPPKIGSAVLLEIARQAKPLIIVDPFLYAHGADENSSKEMAPVMQCLREYAVAGGALVLNHHATKTGGSRGTTAIQAAVDVELFQEMDELDVITIKSGKSRIVRKQNLVVRADFETMQFFEVESPGAAQRKADLAKLKQIIADNPGLSQAAIAKKFGGKKERVLDLLKAGRVERLWEARAPEGPGKPILYFLPGAPEQENLYAQDEPVVN